MPRGGKRPGAGRPRKYEKFAAKIDATDAKIAAQLPAILKAMLELAKGHYAQDSETWEPAGTVLIDEVQVENDKSGRPHAIKTRVKAFPDKEDDEMVLTKRTRTWAAPDGASCRYLADRIMGKPGPEMEPEEEEDEEQVRVTAAARLAALEELASWQQAAQRQIESIRNPLEAPPPSE